MGGSHTVTRSLLHFPAVTHAAYSAFVTMFTSMQNGPTLISFLKYDDLNVPPASSTMPLAHAPCADFFAVGAVGAADASGGGGVDAALAVAAGASAGALGGDTGAGSCAGSAAVPEQAAAAQTPRAARRMRPNLPHP